MLISPVASPIGDDFYTLSGADIPADAVIEFSTSVGVVTVSPDFVRPHLALVERLPASIPPGPATVRMSSPSTPASNSLAVTVSAGSPQPVRLLHAGEAKARPYTVVFVANPGIESASGATFRADTILTNRHGFHAVVRHCFQNLFLMTEDMLRRDDIDARMRLVSVFDTTRPADAANSLTQEVPQSDIMGTRRAVLPAFFSRYGLVADIVIIIHGSLTHTRASAWHTTDDATLAATPYTFDGVARRHGHFPRIPGSAAIPVTLDTTGLTVLHEFGHAASDFNNGRVTDLYDDGGNDPLLFYVNKKFRAAVGDPVPNDFADYQGTSFDAAPSRGARPYPAGWRSYHPGQIDAARPNLMDNYWATQHPQRCRLDRLTFDWFRDRLDAKLGR